MTVTKNTHKAYKTLIIEIEDKTAWIRLNRPANKNSLNNTLVGELTEVIRSVGHANGSFNAIGLTGEGDTFCAGADLQEMHEGFSPHALWILLTELWNLPIPLVVLCRKGVYGGGLGLVACADVALAAPQTRFCFSEVNLGLAPATISPFVLAKMGAAVANELFLTARSFDETLAQQHGLIHQVVAVADWERVSRETLQGLGEKPRSALIATKRLSRMFWRGHFDPTGKTYVECLNQLRGEPETQRRLKSFFASRGVKKSTQMDERHQSE